MKQTQGAASRDLADRGNPTGHDVVGSSRFLAFGHIAGAIVHEARNPLQSLLLAARSLSEQTDQPPDPRLLDIVAKGSKRLAQAMDELSGLLRLTPTSRGPVSVQETVKRVVTYHAYGPFQINGQTDVHAPADLDPADATPMLLEDVIGMILTGAKAHIGKQQLGSIDVTLRNQSGGTISVLIEATRRTAPPDRLEWAPGDPTSHQIALGLQHARSIMPKLGGELTEDVSRDGHLATWEMMLRAWSG